MRRSLPLLKRNVGYKASTKPRPPTHKEKRVYFRRKREQAAKAARHSPPNSKANARRKAAKQGYRHLLLEKQRNSSLTTTHNNNNNDHDETYYDALVADLMGNTSYLTSSPTPMPKEMSHLYDDFYTRVSHATSQFSNLLLSGNDDDESESSSETTTKEAASFNNIDRKELDENISGLIRAHRDVVLNTSSSSSSREHKHPLAKTGSGKRIGLQISLDHLVSDLHIPVQFLGTKSYSSLLSLCKNPAEANQVLKLMTEHQVMVEEYHWSCLIDMYSDMADFETAWQIIQDMNNDLGIKPNITCITSLLKGCYKVINNVSKPAAQKARAAEVGWEAWKQSRVWGVQADVMAYGAIIRLFAARGRPEKVINLIEEMQQFDIRPTTLIYTTALQAVARSHQITLRFEGGKSRKGKKREIAAAYYGKLTRKILIDAESSEIEHDNGFVTALLQCAATAGDAATAKAIMIASEIRRNDHLRTIGDTSTLKQLKENAAKDIDDPNNLLEVLGKQISSSDESDSSELLSSSSNKYLALQPSSADLIQTNQRLNTDSRQLKTLLHAYSNAMEPGGLGDLWGGEWNKGFLDEATLIRIKERRKPNYYDNSIPGQSGVETSLSAWDHDIDDDSDSKRLRKKKFRDWKEIPDAGYTLEDVDEDIYRMYQEEDRKRRGLPPLERDPFVDAFVTGENIDSDDKTDGMDFHKEGDADLVEDFDEEGDANLVEDFDEDDVADMTNFIHGEEDYEEDDYDDKQAKTELDKFIEELSANNSRNGSYEEGFEAFYEALLQDKDFKDVNEKEAKEIYEMLRSDEDPNDDRGEAEEGALREVTGGGDTVKDETCEFSPFDESFLESFKGQEDAEIVSSPVDKSSYLVSDPNSSQNIDDFSLAPMSAEVLLEDSPKNLSKLQEDRISMLQDALPGLPRSRIEKVAEIYSKNLAAPSLIQLVPALRENLPENLSYTWLRDKNLKDARYAIEQAKSQAGSLDRHTLNAMLGVEVAAGKFNDALMFHNTKFKSLGNIEPDHKADRQLIQLLLKHKRISKVLELKDSIEKQGRKLDLLSYGSLMEFYSKQNNLGSALLVLNECLEKHGGHKPGEHYLKQIRILCRHNECEEKVELEKLIGPDPFSWVKDGESRYKREYSKRGKRSVNEARNKFIRI